MDRIVENVLRWSAAAVGFVAGLYGGWTEAMKVLVLFMAIDYVLGCACALAGKSPKTESGHFWSKVAFLGILKKVGIMALVLVAIQLDRAINAGGSAIEGGQTMFRTATVFFYIANEGLSIVENAGLLGAPVPRPLKQAMELLRDRSDGEDPEEHHRDGDQE